jgi:hypothetical protein
MYFSAQTNDHPFQTNQLARSRKTGVEPPSAYNEDGFDDMNQIMQEKSKKIFVCKTHKKNQMRRQHQPRRAGIRRNGADRNAEDRQRNAMRPV